MKIRRSHDRGHVALDWLDSRHSFSFGSYYDPEHMGFRALRVINEDVIAPATGFGEHPHRDMEIVTYMLGGRLEHGDSMGNGSQIRPGDVQRMSAGTGVVHSERNPSPEKSAHLLQIWIEPRARGTKPSYEQKHFDAGELAKGFCLVASEDGRDGSVEIQADVSLYAAKLAAGKQASLSLAPGRHVWVQLISGQVELEGETLAAGDGAASSELTALDLKALDDSELLVFDLA